MGDARCLSIGDRIRIDIPGGSQCDVKVTRIACETDQELLYRRHFEGPPVPSGWRNAVRCVVECEGAICNTEPTSEAKRWHE